MKMLILTVFIALISLSATERRVVCYHKGTSTKAITPDVTICTHIVYAFVNIGTDGSLVSYESNKSFGTLAKFAELKSQSATVKLLVGFGGGSAVNFPNVSISETAVNVLGKNIAEMLKTYNLDGASIDWENLAGTTPEAITGLLAGVRDALPSNKLLIIDAIADRNQVNKYYDVPSISSLVDFINLMTYDFHGAWELQTYYQTPLYSGPLDKTDYWKTLNIDACAKHWISKGVPSDKIVIGIPLYGRTYKLADPNNNGIGASATGIGNSTTISYTQICQNIQNNGWTSVYNEPQVFNYAYKDDQWVSYEDLQSLSVKVNYVIDNGLGGIMFWAVDMDDHTNICGNGKFPMISLTYELLMATDD